MPREECSSCRIRRTLRGAIEKLHSYPRYFVRVVLLGLTVRSHSELPAGEACRSDAKMYVLRARNRRGACLSVVPPSLAWSHVQPWLNACLFSVVYCTSRGFTPCSSRQFIVEATSSCAIKVSQLKSTDRAEWRMSTLSAIFVKRGLGFRTPDKCRGGSEKFTDTQTYLLAAFHSSHSHAHLL